MNLIKLAVKRPVTMVIVVAVMLILGLFTYSKLPVDLYPEMKFPMAAVITSYPGAGPEEVESQVTEPIESMLATMSNVKELQSTSSSGQSVVMINFNWGTDMDGATMDIREKIGFIETWLPDSADKPMVIKMDPTLMPIMQIGLSGGDSLAQLQTLAEDVIEPRLSRIPEVASVLITGGDLREVKVEVDPVKLENYGLSLSQVVQVLQTENFNMSGGKMDQGERRYFVRNLQQFENVEDIRNVAILTPTGATVFLRDVAEITDGYKDKTQMTRVNSGDAVGIHIMKQTDANTVKASAAVREELQKIQQEHKMDLEYKVVFDQADFINQSINTTLRMILEGAILAMLILFLFLRNMRSTLVIATAIPLSIIATFVVMYFTGYTINLITMGGLALGVGRIVDDSIVVFENIYRHRALGEPPMEAAIKGASEVGGAVLAATLTIIAVFLPIVFVEGLASILFKPLAITISVAIFCSLLVALTVIPLLSSRVLSDRSMQRLARGEGRVAAMTQKFGGWIDGLGDRYKVLLEKCLRRRRRVVLIVTGLMIASIACAPLVGAEFLPKMDSGEISITIETDKGSQLDYTDQVTRQVENKLLDIGEMDTIFTSVGSSDAMMMGMGTNTDQSTLYVKLVSKNERKRSVDEVAEEIRQAMAGIPGAKITVSVMDVTSGMGAGGGPINIQVRGDDLQVLREISTDIVQVVRNTPGTREVTASLNDGPPEIQVKIDRKRAAALGMTPMLVSKEISTAMEGSVATRYKTEGAEVDVRVRYIPRGEKDMEYLANLTLRNPQGMPVKLSQIATFEMAQGPVQISRVDQVRKAEISGHLLNRDLGTVMSEIREELDQMPLPSGYAIEYGGENKEMMDSFASLAVALLLAIILVYAVMAIQYESFFNPFVIMFSVPTAIIGVIFGLLLTGRSLSVPAFIGLIMLVGIAVSNAIVYVDYLKQLIERGMERNEAIVEAGRVRLRPILMTAFSTILAMFPLALGLGEGSEAQAPLATVVIGGLLVSTLITLVLVPVVYTIFDDWGQKLGARFQRGRRADDADIGLS